MKRMRNLDAAEIFDQVFQVNHQSLEHFKHPLTNIVFMGMGEPLLNFRNVMDAIHLISSPEGLGMSAKRITVSTAGIVKMIKRLAHMEVKFNLATSLHAADDVKRNKIMPINEQNNLASLKEALRLFFRKTRNKITLEYIAFKNFNDTLEDAHQLIKFCDSFPATINIIEYNPVDGVDFEKAEEKNIDQFALQLRKHKIPVTVRKSRGKDIDAACGQLANKTL
jgi:23S rRNA (adenine2503-C2)-methyltransferase